ncbi:MAG: ATP-binding protein [Acidobacteria bacterium]|nr:ATP-binding protein [Acidobacteriota bacterium]
MRELSVTAEWNSLEPATQFLRSAAVAAGLPEPLQNYVDLILEELFVNITRYAYPDGQAGKVDIQYSVPRPGLLEIEIADQGKYYNPLELESPNLDLALDDRPVGGLGIFLVKQYTESIDYRRDDGWNRVNFRVSAESLLSAT